MPHMPQATREGTVLSTFPPPHKIGLPSHFTSWRPQQDEAVLDLIASTKRFCGLVLPTGSGKSLVYLSYAVLSQGRTCILTSTKSLQDQLTGDFGRLSGYQEVKGQSNYLCLAEPPTTVDEGPCHGGVFCELKKGGCTYYDVLRSASVSRIVVANYAFWLYSNRYGAGIGKFDTLVLDEAHAAPDELAGFLSAYISDKTCERFGIGYATEGNWRSWVEESIPPLTQELSHLELCDKARDVVHRVVACKRLLAQIELIHGTEGSWVAERRTKGMQWDLTDPSPYAESLLFRETPKVIFSSATVRQKSLSLLGISEEEVDFFEGKSLFPVKRRPVYVCYPKLDGQSVRLTFRSSDAELEAWLRHIDAIIADRLDRRGVIHTVSYARAKLVYERSAFRRYMLLHKPGGEQITAAVEALKMMVPPAILVSPAVATGIDLPYSAAEYQIIAKVPFPDMRSKILQARAQIDSSYVHYLTMQTLVQAAGRGMRAEDDQCETFLIDGQWSWFGSKYATYSPRWFRAAIRSVSSIPKPPQRLDAKKVELGVD